MLAFRNASSELFFTALFKISFSFRFQVPIDGVGDCTYLRLNFVISLKEK